MKTKGYKLTMTVLTGILIIMCGVSIGILTYSWYQSAHELENMYEIPATGSLMIGFVWPVTEEDVSGWLFPAVLMPGATANNQTGLAESIQREAGIATFSTAITLHSGTLFEESLRFEMYVNASPVGHERNLVETLELEVLSVYTVAGVPITHVGSTNELYIESKETQQVGDDEIEVVTRVPLGKVADSLNVVYIREGVAEVQLASEYVPQPEDNLIFDCGYLRIHAEEEIDLTVSGWITTLDELTAPDLRDNIVNVAIVVISPDIEEA